MKGVATHKLVVPKNKRLNFFFQKKVINRNRINYFRVQRIIKLRALYKLPSISFAESNMETFI